MFGCLLGFGVFDELLFGLFMGSLEVCLFSVVFLLLLGFLFDCLLVA